MPLLAKANSLEQYVEEKFIDENGVVYTSIEADSQQPWAEEIWNENNDFLPVKGFAPWEVLNYENSGMCTGAYLAAQVYRFRATGEADAREKARRCFNGLFHIYRLGQAQTKGFFPKTYGARLSHEISSDQYLYAIKALIAYWPVASEEERTAIRTMICEMVDFWTERNYRYDYFSHADMQWPLRRFPALLYAAHFVSGEEKYLAEVQRLNQEEKAHLSHGETTLHWKALHQRPFSETEQKLGNRYLGYWITESASMDIMQCDECLQHSQEHTREWLQTMQLAWQDALLSLNALGLSYSHTLYDPQTGASSSPTPQWLHDGPDPLGWRFLRRTGGVLTSRSTLLARAGVNVARWLPHLQPQETILLILQNIELDQMRHCLDPDSKQLLPQHKYMTRWVDGDSLTNWLWAYWQGRFEKIIEA